jgi:hypothetical protein
MGHAKLTSFDHSVEWPDFLKKAAGKPKKMSEEVPIVINMTEKNAEDRLKKTLVSIEVSQVVDTYDEQFAELQLSLNAHLYRANDSVQRNSIKEKLIEHYGTKKSWQLGAWVYFPWSRELVHILDEDNFTALRTIRNRDLISADEQTELYKYSVACVGMSVGSASAISLVLSGASKDIKVADGAVISGSNLNRILAGVSDVGKEKSLVVAQMLYEMNPFIRVQKHSKVNAQNIGDLFDEQWKVKAVIDEIDDLEIKIRLRLEAKKRKLPVFMATELADSVMLDVERFDLTPDRPLFHGMIPGIEKLIDNKDMNHREWMKHAARIIGTSNMPLDMQKSLLKIGSSIVTHPQLGSTVMVTGGVTTYAIKRVALGKSMPSGRTSISLNELLVPEFNKVSHRWRHRKHTRVMNRALDAM